MAKLAKDELIKAIEEMSVLDLSDLVKALEEKFGVTAAMPMATAASSQPAAQGAEEPKEEQTTFNVVLTNGGTNKIGTIKALRAINQNLGLKEAKDLVDTAPKEILVGVNKATAEEARKKLTDAGGTVELK